ncbi:MAG: PAS domain S-box protein [Candidatus Kuenenia sp.]|nr:PAS domain S-box protein [Candidatus Kuenenia hertensis]
MESRDAMHCVFTRRDLGVCYELRKIATSKQNRILPNMSQKNPASETTADSISTTPNEITQSQQSENVQKTPDDLFYIVGIGASAGGLDAIIQFFSHMPPENGLAFIIVQHFAPGSKSILPEILQKITSMTVSEIEHGNRLQPDHVYIMPSDKHVITLNKEVFLEDFKEPPSHTKPIDNFFISLAHHQGRNTAGIILSGTGTDGAAGIKAIKEAGGLTLAQEVSSAQFDGMPKSAIATGCVDFILHPQEMPGILLKRITIPEDENTENTETIALKNTRRLKEIINILLTKTGHNFSHYKKNTVARRVEKRMSQSNIKSISKYISLLQQNPSEINALFRELLITVTCFFREMENDFVLKEKVFSEILKNKSAGDTVRIWVPGCATGEEPYSIAMLFSEYLEAIQQPLKIQIFATDINENAIRFARAALYPLDRISHVSPARLERFFHKKNHSFAINDRIREMVIFSYHNLIKDPPFSRIDLISCKNLLIYFDATLQEKLLPLFFYILRPNGFLLLGKSESIRGFTDLFATIDEKNRVFKRSDVSFPSMKTIAIHPEEEKTFLPEEKNAINNEPPINIRETLAKVLFDDFSPPCVIIDEEHHIVHLHGQLDRFLKLPEGEPNLNIIKMAHKTFRPELTVVLKNALKQKKTIRSKGVRMVTGNVHSTVNIIVRPFPEAFTPRQLYIIIFQEQGSSERNEGKTPVSSQTDGAAPRIAELEKELDSTKKSLCDLLENLEDSNEKLILTNETFREKEEELRSTKEELETTKEELQSMNEELNIINAELQHKIDDLSKANSDINTLLSSTNIGTVFLDRNLCIKRFTPPAEKMMNLIASDVNRPICHLNTFLIQEKLIEHLEKVLNTLIPYEKEITVQDNTWYLVRFLPYQTEKNIIDGVVITIVNITQLKRAREEVSLLEKLILSINESEDFNSAMKSVLHTVCEVTNWTLGEVWFPDKSNSYLVRSASWFPQEPVLQNFDVLSRKHTFERGIGLPGRAWSTKQVEWVRDVTLDKNFVRAELAETHGLKAGLAIPVLANDVVVAVINFFMSEACDQDEQFIKLISSIASQLGMTFRRKQAEESLKHFRLLAENIPETFWIASHDFSRIVYISPAYETIWGRTCKSLYEQPKSWLDSIHPDDNERVLASLEKHIKGEKPFEEEFRIIKPDGTIRTILDRAFFINDPENKFNSIVGIAQDITERIKTQKHVKLLSSVVEQSIEGIAVADLDGYLQFVNYSFATMHGYTTNELTGKHLSIFHTPGQMPAVNASLRYLKEKGFFTGELWHVRRDGTEFPTLMNNTILKDEKGNAIAMIGTLIDITENKKTADELKKSSHFLQIITEGTTDFIFIKDAECRLIMVNSAVCKYLGKSLQEITGKTSFEILPKDVAEKITKNDLAVLHSGETQTFEETIPGKEHTAKIFLATKSPYRDSNGNIIGIVGISKDITEIKRKKK